MKNYKNTLVALIITIVIVIVGTFIVDNMTKKDKIYTSKTSSENDKVSSSNKTTDTDKAKTSSSSEKETSSSNQTSSSVVISDSSTASAIESSNVGSDIKIDTTASKDDQAIEYFNGAEAKVDAMDDNVSKLKTEGKALFVKLVDFIFYDTTINGIKFDDLTKATQDKLVAIANNVDAKIETKVPGYKETVKDYANKTYTYLSDKLKNGITYLDEKIQDNVDSNTYTAAKEETSSAIDTIKDSISTAVDVSKDAIATGKSKIKQWYEGWR